MSARRAALRHGLATIAETQPRVYRALMHYVVMASVGGVAIDVLVAILSVVAVVARIKVSMDLTARRKDGR